MGAVCEKDPTPPCPDSSARDANDNCPTTTTNTGTTPTASGCDSQHNVFDPASGKCYESSSFAPCPGKAGAIPSDAAKGHGADGVCANPKTGIPQLVPVNSDGTCLFGGVHIANVKNSCIYEKQGRDPDGTCPIGYVLTNADAAHPCNLRIHDPLKDGTCPIGYSHMAITQLCKINADTSSGLQVDELPAGYCPMGYTHMGTRCVIE